MCACGRVHSLCEHKIHHTLAVALTVTHSLCDERTRTHEVYRCTVHSRHQGPRGTHAQLLASRRGSLRGMPCVCQRFVSEPLDCTRVGLRPSVPRQRRRARRSAARRVAVRRLLLMLLPRRAVVPARGGTQLEGGVGDRRAGSLSSADAASRLGGGSCFAARARRRTRLRSRGSSKERTRWQSCWAGRGRRTRRCVFPFLSESLIRADEITSTVLTSRYFKTCNVDQARTQRPGANAATIRANLSVGAPWHACRQS